MELKGSQTEKNLMAAFAGESQARNKYTFYAQKAREDGYEQVARVFDETANNEKEHGELWLKILLGGVIPGTEENLSDAIKGENYEHQVMYPEFAKVAREEGFESLGELFMKVGSIEDDHSKRYSDYFNEIQSGQAFHRDVPVKWKCLNCGYETMGSEAPAICPVCSHLQGFFTADASK